MRQPFAGFRSLSANFTPTPNQFFDQVVGHYPLRVVSVVAILIRSTLGWQDEVTGEKRIEAELPLSAFIRPELSENSVRQGLREAMAAGFVVETAKHTNRDGARYALRWSDAAAQREAIERHRRAVGDRRPLAGSEGALSGDGLFGEAETASGDSNPGGPIIGPPNSGGPNSAPPYKSKETFSGKETISEGKTKPLNVTQGSENTTAGGDSTADGSEENAYRQIRDKAVREAVTLTEDAASAARWSQLMEICLRHNACDAWTEALHSTHRAKVRSNRPANLGAYLNRVLVRELDKRGIAVPTKAEKAEAGDVRSLIGASLGAAFGAAGKES
ncbi:MAG: hypothetical protein V4671_09850 [Armatimonadota bacterium]